MNRLVLLLLALLTMSSPARADDISAASRSVVRVVVVAFEDGEIVEFGHGSGFAVASNRIVTNAHVVALAAQYPKNVAIGVVPSQGTQSFGARLVTLNAGRDLALLEMESGTVPPVPLFLGPVQDGMQVAALGYPGNVDLATAQSMNDYITPLPAIRSVGILSSERPINNVMTLLHTANIARGHSGGPLLDQCGRVLGVNTLITRNEEGDAPFAFAVANRELAGFLRQAQQPFTSITTACISMADRLRQDQERAQGEARSRIEQLQARERQQQQALEQAQARLEDRRENMIGIAVLLLVLSLLAFGGAGIMLVKDRGRPGVWLGGTGALLLLAAAGTFFTRPSRGEAALEAEPQAEAKAARLSSRNLCRLVPERSRVTVSAVQDVPLEWSSSGCVNGRTQYAQNGEVWTRILVPNADEAVSVLEVRPATGEYVVSRYLLDAAAMARSRGLRRSIEIKSCTADAEARAILADQQREIAAILPAAPHERLVYRCEPAGASGGSAQG